MTILLYGFFPGKATEIIRNVISFAMKLLKSEKIVIIITAVFLALMLGFALGQREGETPVVFGESGFQSRGADNMAGETVASPENGEERLTILNINLATAEELETLRGIGPVLAQRIIEYRETKGPFKTVEDITKVQGIGAAVYNDIWQYISVE